MREVILLSGHKNVTGVGENRLEVVQRDATLRVRLHHADIDMRGRRGTRSIVIRSAGAPAATPLPLPFGIIMWRIFGRWICYNQRVCTSNK